MLFTGHSARGALMTVLRDADPTPLGPPGSAFQAQFVSAASAACLAPATSMTHIAKLLARIPDSKHPPRYDGKRAALA